MSEIDRARPLAGVTGQRPRPAAPHRVLGFASAALHLFLVLDLGWFWPSWPSWLGAFESTHAPVLPCQLMSTDDGLAGGFLGTWWSAVV